MCGLNDEVCDEAACEKIAKKRLGYRLRNAEAWKVEMDQLEDSVRRCGRKQRRSPLRRVDKYRLVCCQVKFHPIMNPRLAVTVRLTGTQPVYAVVQHGLTACHERHPAYASFTNQVRQAPLQKPRSLQSNVSPSYGCYDPL